MKRNILLIVLVSALLPLTAFLSPLYACTNLIVAKKASVDGSVIVSYNADSYGMYGNMYRHVGGTHQPGEMRKIYEWDTNKYLGEIPQAARTYNVVGQMNENQVSICETTFGGREEVVDPKGIIDYGSLIYIGLERSRTAREAIQIMTDLVAKYGYCSEGETFTIADKNEVWVTEMSEMAKETWEMMKLQYQLGRMRSTSVQSAEASYLSILTQANDVRRQIRSTENALSLLIGQAGQQIPRTTLAQQVLPSEFATGVGVALLKNRPDVHNAEMKLAACFHDVQTARSQFYPTITIGATGAFTNGSGAFNPGKWMTNLFAGLTQPIFARGALIANLKVSKLQYEQAFNSWQNTIYSAGNEVSNALVNYNMYDANSKLEAQRIEVLTKNVEDTKALYQSKGSTYLEVLTAQTQLLSSQINKVTDDFQKMQAVVSLYTALGGGGK